MEIFVSSPFSQEFDAVFAVIAEESRSKGFEAYRVDQSSSGVPLSDEITRKLRECRLVVADITGNNPNVLNEIGQAQVLGKPLVLISQDSPRDAAFNVRGLRILRYTRQSLEELHRILGKAFSEATSPNELLRSMLVPSTLGRPTPESKFVIVASPLSYRRATRRHGGYKVSRRTSSDYVGVRNIMGSFGILYGFDALPEIIDPEDYDDDVITKPMNMYCISSPKANVWTGRLLEKLNEHWVPRIEFKADPSSKDLRNIKVSLYSGNRLLEPFDWDRNVGQDRYAHDFGIIIRIPNPYNEDKMLVILAGRSSLGTEASCSAFTSPAVIDELRRRLNAVNVDLDNHKSRFWALVSMKRTIGDEKEEAIIDSLQLDMEGKFSPR